MLVGEMGEFELAGVGELAGEAFVLRGGGRTSAMKLVGAEWWWNSLSS
jgi:hypothetical protein